MFNLLRSLYFILGWKTFGAQHCGGGMRFNINILKSMEIKLKRVYDPVSPADGFRVYVDRLWPRGLSHETFHYDLWDKDIAPSDGLRKWFHADPDGRWQEFERRYLYELEHSAPFTEFRRHLSGHNVVTLLYSSRDEEHNNARVVEETLG